MSIETRESIIAHLRRELARLTETEERAAHQWERVAMTQRSLQRELDAYHAAIGA